MEELKKEYEFPLYLFHSGKNYKAYEFFGCHRINGDTFVFRVWAPHAVSVSPAGGAAEENRVPLGAFLWKQPGGGRGVDSVCPSLQGAGEAGGAGVRPYPAD